MVNMMGVTDDEERVISTYLEEKLPPVEKLKRMQDRVQILLTTNAKLQNSLLEQEVVCCELNVTSLKLESDVAQQDKELAERKRQQAELDGQLKAVYQGQRNEELRMRNAVMVLEERLNSLTRENVRLEAQRQEEQETLEVQAKKIRELDHQIAVLQERKAALEPEELDSIQSESILESDRQSEVHEVRDAHDELLLDTEGGPVIPVEEELPSPPPPEEEAPPRNPFPQAPGVPSSSELLRAPPSQTERSASKESSRSGSHIKPPGDESKGRRRPQPRSSAAQGAAAKEPAGS